MRLMAAPTLIWLLLAASPLIFLLGLSVGPVVITLPELFHSLFMSSENSQQKMIIEVIRLPRVILAMLVGMLLATCGAILQGLFRNPLADPTLIGVSAGASVGASFVIVLGVMLFGVSQFAGVSLVVLGAFCGALLSSAIVYRLATSERGTSVTTMLLAGIAISSLAMAINHLFSFFADNDMLRRISLWQMGNLDNPSWVSIGICLFAVVVLAIFIPRESRALNAMLLGESEARHLGVGVEWLKRRLIFFSSMGIAIAVAVAGTVAFVGLMVPHLVRLLIGPDHRFLMPASALMGALLMVVADAIARIVVSPAELPVGVVTALLGAPFFIMLLLQHKKGQW